MCKFNYKPGSKTPKGSKPKAIRIITKDHQAYQIYILAQTLQQEDGIHRNNVDKKYIDLAIKQFKNSEVKQ